MTRPEPRRWNGETPFSGKAADLTKEPMVRFQAISRDEGYTVAMNSPTVQGLVEACKAYLAHVGGADISCARMADAALATYNAGMTRIFRERETP